MKLTEKFELLKETLVSVFPGISIESIEPVDPESDENSDPIFFSLPQSNRSFIESPYFYGRQSLVHFTDITALNSILQGRSMRFYNLRNLEDPREFTFAGKIFSLSKELTDDARDNIFISSFCERKILKTASAEFNMWRMYGKNGKGVALVFSQFNNPRDWNDFHISKVIYGSDERSKFNKLTNVLFKINNSGTKIMIDFGKLLAFHKSKLFQIESEVRIIYDRRLKRGKINSRKTIFKDKLIFPLIKTDLLKIANYSGSDVRYLELPIYYKDYIYYDLEVPLLKLEEIIIGYNYIEQVPKLIDGIKSLSEACLGYLPKVRQTRLKNYYWDIKRKTSI